MSKFINRSFEIISNTLKETGKEYTSNIQSLINDAKDIKSNLTKSTTDAADTFARLKTSNVTKKISDWFYGEENSFDSSMGDDFDAGFKIDDSEGAKLDGEDRPKALDADSMSDIANKQSATALKIGRRQTEQSVANTAEIISVVNNRSSEMLASINNINKTLLGISDRLDKIIKIQTTGFEDKKEEKEIDKGGLYSDGKLSLGRIFEASKRGLGGNSVVSSLSLATQLLAEGTSPEQIAKMGLEMVTHKQFNALGGKSIDEIGKRFNEAIGTATQAAMNEIIGSKPFQKLFGDITSFEGDKDYGTIIKNSYDTKKAQFDGMTRHTIVNLIPEMLANINESISGVSWHISNNGGWVKGPAKNEFASVTKQAFASTGLSQTVQDRINTVGKQTLGDKFSEADVDTAAKALNAVIVQDLHQRGSRQFRLTDLKGDMSQYVIPAVRTLCGLKNDPEYWASVCNTIILQLSSGIMNSQTFIQNINQSLQNMMSDAIDFSQSGKRNATQASKITQKMVMSQFWNEHKDQYIKPGESGSSDDSGKITDGRIKTASGSNEKYTNNEYLGNIFRLLNRGINVRTTGKDPFPELDLEHNPDKPLPTTDQAFGKAMAALINGGGVNDDDDLIKKTVNSVMSGTMNSLTGNNAGGGGSGGGGSGLGSFLGNFLGIAGGRGMGSLIDRALSGTLKDDIKGLFRKEGKVGQAASQAMGKIKDATGYVTGRYAYDSRVKEAQEKVFGEDGLVDRAKGKVKEVAGKVKSKIDSNEHAQKIKQTGGRLANNAIYNVDSMALKGAENRVKNFEFDPEELSDDMALSQARLALQYIGDGALDDAELMAESIDDSKVKTAILQHIKDIRKIDEIKEKRKKGETALANGETPEIGSVLQDAPEKPQKDSGDEASSPFEVIKKGLSGITKVLGKIAKFVMKIAEKGMRDLKYGLLSMKDGLFGSKEKDENGNVISENKGLIRNLAIEAPKKVYAGAINLGKKAVNKIGDMEFSKHITDKKGNVLTTREVAGIAKDKILNTTFTGQWVRNDDGSIARETYTDKKGREKERKKMTNTATVADLLKDPKKVLKQSFENISTDVTKSFKNIISDFKDKFGKVTSVIKNSKIGQAVGLVVGFLGKVGSSLKDFAENVMSSVKNKIQEAMKSIADSKVGQFAKNAVSKIKNKRSSDGEGRLKVLGGRFTSGMTKGFKKAKEKAAEEKKKQSEKEAREANPIQANIEDTITGKKESIISKMHESLKGIAEKLGLIHDEQVAENGEDSTDTGTDPSTTPPSDETTTSSTPDAGSAGTGGSGEEGSTDSGESSTPTSSTPDAGSAGSSGGSNKKGGLIGDMLGNLGEIFGGFSQALLGIGELIVSIVASLEGLQALKDLVMSILTEGLEPLNQAFEAVMELIKPIVSILKDMVTTIAETVVTIAESLIAVIQPIIEAIQPIIQTLLDVLTPILEIITALVDVIMVPIMIIMQIIQPIIENIGYQLQMISGILQIGMGIIIGMLGGLLFGIGAVAKLIGKFPVLGGSVGKVGDSLADTGKNMLNTSKTMITSGVDQMKQGIEGMISQLQAILPGGEDGSKKEEEKEDPKVDTEKVNLGSDFGAGDVNTSTVNNSWSYMYGSGNNTTMNQHSYGNYMNMGERGCGPVVLADAYSRRTGEKVNPASLAARMAGSGAYEPSRGTSVGSMVSTGSAMGMGMRVGGVTQASLKQASPTNPITLLGSGTGFGTKSGNSHYVNVVGTDRNGGAYVANPMTGKVERQSATSLTLNSKLGLYGSGDEENEYEQYGFDEATTEALNKLKTLTGKLTSIFTGDSKADSMKKTIEAADEENKAKTIKRELGDEYEAIEKQAKDQLKADNPKRDGEDDAAYETRMEKLWEKKGNSYIVKLGGQAAYDKGSERGKNMLKGAEEAAAGYEEASSAMEKIDLSEIDSAGSSGESALGAEMAPFSPIINTITDISDKTSSKSPVHDYFAATSGDAFDDDSKRLTSISTLDSGWYGKSDAPVSKEGVGSTGNDSEAIVINNGGNDDTVRAITGGTVTYVTRGGKHGNSDPNGGLGNSVKWRDSAGMYHWYFHLDEVDKAVQEGSNIEPNQILGKFGSTGMTGRSEDFKLLRYMVTKSNSRQTGDDGHINPLTYWKFEESGGELSGDTPEEQTYSYLVSAGMSPIGAAGMMGCFKHESNFQYDNLENIYQDKFGYKAGAEGDASYAADVDSKKESEDDFVYGRHATAYGGQTPGEAVGFGIAQFTSSGLKRDLYNKTVKKGKSITDKPAQLDAILSVLKERGIFEPIKNASNPVEANKIFLWKYEAGTGYTSDEQVLKAYPWMLQSNPNGVVARHNSAEEYYNSFGNKHISPSGSSNKASDKEGVINGRFVSTVSNATGGNKGDLIEAASQVWEAYTNKVPSGTYDHGNRGPVTTRSGITLEHLHPDCSGMLSATMNYMGYTFDPTKSQAGSCDKYRWCTYDIVGKRGSDGFILGPDGKPSDDWIFMDFDPNDMQEGDIITTQEHVGMYIQPGSDDQNALGFDAGNGSRTAIVGPGQAKSYLDGDPNWRSKLQWTMGPSYPGLRTTLRYVGSKAPAEDDSSNSKFAFSGATAPKGSGDVSDFWTDSVYGSNNVQMDVPPLDMSKLMDESNENNGVSPIIVNKYDIKPDQTNNSELLDKMSKMTFNVRARRVEQLLEELIEKIDGDKPKPQPTTDATDTNLFQSNDIPEQVTRLSRG